MANVKWSEFADVGLNIPADRIVGLRGGEDVQFIPVIATDLQFSTFTLGLVGGTSDAITVALNPAVSSLADGLTLIFTATQGSNTTTTPTLQVDANAAVPIRTIANPSLLVGDIVPMPQMYVYSSGSNSFVLTNPAITNADASLVTTGYYNSIYDFGTANDYAGILPIATLNNTSILGIPAGIYSIVTSLGTTNTGASTMTINGGAPIPIRLQGGSDLIGGEMLGGGTYLLGVNRDFNAFTLINPSPTNVPSAAGTTILIGTEYQNVTNYQQMITIYLEVASATTADILLGVDSNATPTQQTIVAALTTAVPMIIPVPVIVPAGSYLLLSTSGTISATITGQIVMSA